MKEIASLTGDKGSGLFQTEEHFHITLAIRPEQESLVKDADQDDYQCNKTQEGP